MGGSGGGYMTQYIVYSNEQGTKEGGEVARVGNSKTRTIEAKRC